MGFFTLAASRWRMISGYARVSTAEQNLGSRHDTLKPAFVDPTEACGDNAAGIKRRRERHGIYFNDPDGLVVQVSGPNPEG